MDSHPDVIPTPDAVREEFAASLKRTALLRRLYRLSIDAYQEKQKEAARRASEEKGVAS
jgi:hypothetical protein